MHEDIDTMKNLSEEDRVRLEQTGMMLSAVNRCGTYFQADQDVVRSECTYEGIEMLPTDIALKKYEWLGDYYWNLVDKDKDEYTRYVADQKISGYTIIARKGSKNIFPLETCLFMQKDEIQTVHNIVIAEEGAELHLIAGCASSHAVRNGAHYGVTEFYVGKDALISTTMIHTWGENVDVYPRSATLVEEGGTFLSNYICMKPVSHIQMYPVARLTGENSVARFNSVVLAPEGSHLDLGQRAVLEAKGTSAELISRVITRGGDVIARSHIIGAEEETRGHIECKGLILDGGSIHAVPEIEGRLSNTELSHEAAVGKIARDEIEYLMARGLDEEEATATIIRGFLDVRIQGLPETLQKQIDAAIDAAEDGF
ncbi:hypothetical protein AZH53_10425 [Methanomicrobiaceae archaeon CYW5]|uniref:SufD family Fe-S cluster assembly protein n=1 Tax=Methanovulcanius yangii TaxID=1789227 RepID=UPI0029CA409B|nr:SufD family Fe-S cluster assembly protein [Methanovulcanius yangii]MBT8508820.1 hypothetical protein [Methanovulcanius yangii]